jgi:tRNA A37 threonylcarbamoyladenosine biosynthesis protein TsaE
VDKIVEDVMAKYRQRSEVGIAKYGTTLEDNKATLIEWLTHLQEELMDATLYIEKLKSDLDKR